MASLRHLDPRYVIPGLRSGSIHSPYLKVSCAKLNQLLRQWCQLKQKPVIANVVKQPRDLSTCTLSGWLTRIWVKLAALAAQILTLMLS